MHLLFAVGLFLGLVGVMSLAVATIRRRHPGRGKVAFLIGGCALGVALAIALSLRFAQSSVCVVLGGRWASTDQACAHELGGNGSNDPSNDAHDIWPWTNSFDGSWFEDLQGEGDDAELKIRS